MTRPDEHDSALPDLYEALRQNFGDDAIPDLMGAIYLDALDDDNA